MTAAAAESAEVARIQRELVALQQKIAAVRISEGSGPKDEPQTPSPSQQSQSLSCEGDSTGELWSVGDCLGPSGSSCEDWPIEVTPEGFSPAVVVKGGEEGQGRGVFVTPPSVRSPPADLQDSRRLAGALPAGAVVASETAFAAVGSFVRGRHCSFGLAAQCRPMLLMLGRSLTF